VNKFELLKTAVVVGITKIIKDNENFKNIILYGKNNYKSQVYNNYMSYTISAIALFMKYDVDIHCMKCIKVVKIMY